KQSDLGPGMQVARRHDAAFSWVDVTPWHQFSAAACAAPARILEIAALIVPVIGTNKPQESRHDHGNRPGPGNACAGHETPRGVEIRGHRASATVRDFD